MNSIKQELYELELENRFLKDRNKALLIETGRLNKALDKAMEVIVFYQKGRKYDDKDNKCAEWKAWLLKDE